MRTDDEQTPESGAGRARVPAAARTLGAAGLLPAAAAVIGAASPADWGVGRFAVEAGALYAALILSFLGGTWWGLAARAGGGGFSLFGLAVLPSLAAWALLPWLSPWRIAALGVLLMASPAVDRLLVARGLAPGWWLGLRVPLSLGLGGLTLLLALFAARAGA